MIDAHHETRNHLYSRRDVYHFVTDSRIVDFSNLVGAKTDAASSERVSPLGERSQQLHSEPDL